MSKDIAIDVINEARRLYFGGALLSALFFRSCLFFLKVKFLRQTHFPCNYDFPALRVRRSETRLTVYWALRYQSDSKFQGKGAATFGKKTHVKTKNVRNKYTRWP